MGGAAPCCSPRLRVGVKVFFCEFVVKLETQPSSRWARRV
jgi:hypothetical protein